MSAALILGLVGGLLVVAFLANRIFALTRIPDVLVLMMLGVLLGPVLGLVHAADLDKATKLLGTLAIILVLFEGGLELDLRDTLRHFPGSLLLASLAYVFSVALVTCDRREIACSFRSTTGLWSAPRSDAPAARSSCPCCSRWRPKSQSKSR